MSAHRCLILVDIQNDFCPGGALAVSHGDEVATVANQLIPAFQCVMATQDWHPANHASFAVNHPGARVGQVIDLQGQQQILWPVHCVQDTLGAALLADLNQQGIGRVFQKGTDPEIDSYSGFFDNGHRKSTGLGPFLKQQGITDVYVMGLATDYCVKFTVLDARQLGFNTFLIEDGCRGVELNPGNCAAAIEAMKKAGVSVISSRSIVR